MIRYVTRHSIYEVEGSRIRRVSGANPTVLPVPDGEWAEADTVGTVVLGAGQVLYAEKDGRGMIATSRIIEEIEVEPPSPCQGELRRATFYDPAEGCEEDAQEGSDFCYQCDPDGAALDAAEARAEALREDYR